jgi:hypothetical protein
MASGKWIELPECNVQWAEAANAVRTDIVKVLQARLHQGYTLDVIFGALLQVLLGIAPRG